MFICRHLPVTEIDSWEKYIDGNSTASFFQNTDWLRLYLKHFQVRDFSLGIYENDKLVGFAPLELREKTVGFLGIMPVLGDEKISDFGDIVALAGKEKEVWETIMSQFPIPNPQADGSQITIECNFIRENSISYKILKELGGKIEEVDSAPYIDLPRTWEEYLLSLDRHNRHEIKRKIRRLEEAKAFKVCFEGSPADIDDLFRLMKLSSEKKNIFLSPKMEEYFRDLINSLWNNKKLELCFLKIDGKNIAVVILFNFKDEVLLYNSGYDPQYYKLAPGLLLKAYTIKRAIEKGKKKYDFLRGNERYKYDLGGKEKKLYRIRFLI